MPAAKTSAIPAAPDANAPGKVGVFIPPNDLPKGEERVDSREGKPWHEINRTRELVEAVQRGEVVPVTVAEFNARQAKAGEKDAPEGQDSGPAKSEPPPGV